MMEDKKEPVISSSPLGGKFDEPGPQPLWLAILTVAAPVFNLLYWLFIVLFHPLLIVFYIILYCIFWR
jgi:hypothetical protein